MHVLPYNEKGPVGSYYIDVNWKNGFEKWKLLRISTPGDGHCFFHAFCNSFFKQYHTQKDGAKRVTRKEIVVNVRKELADMLPQYYDKLSSGNLKNYTGFSNNSYDDFSLSNMQKELNSSNSIGYGYIEYISNVFDKNIYILLSSTCDLFPFGKSEILQNYKSDRMSIVLFFIGDNHYELIGTQNKNGTINTHFSPEHPFIKFLYDKVLARANMIPK